MASETEKKTTKKTATKRAPAKRRTTKRATTTNGASKGGMDFDEAPDLTISFNTYLPGAYSHKDLGLGDEQLLAMYRNMLLDVYKRQAQNSAQYKKNVGGFIVRGYEGHRTTGHLLKPSVFPGAGGKVINGSSMKGYGGALQYQQRITLDE